MKTLLGILILFLSFVGFGFGQNSDVVVYPTETNQATIESGINFTDIQTSFFIGLMAKFSTIVSTNHALYLTDYCTVTDNIFDMPLDCGKYNTTIHVLDDVLASLLPEPTVDLEGLYGEDGFSSDEMSFITGSLAGLRQKPMTLLSMVSTYKDTHIIDSEQRAFMFDYILFGLQSYIDVVDYLGIFIKDVNWLSAGSGATE